MHILRNCLGLLVILTIAISCGDDEGEEEAVGERTDGAVQLAIISDGSLQNPAWSPDGESLLFTRFQKGYNKEGPADLLVFEPDGAVVRTLVSDGSGNISLPGST